MAKYKVLETSFVDNKLVYEGDTVEYSGEVGPNLKLLKGKAAVEEPVEGDTVDTPAK